MSDLIEDFSSSDYESASDKSETSYNNNHQDTTSEERRKVFHPHRKEKLY